MATGNQNDRALVPTIETPPLPANPFQRTAPEHINAGAVEIEISRAVAEAQGKLLIAKRFPRDPMRSYQQIMEACRRKSLAEKAMYTYKRGVSVVSGPSIRLAEEIARCWGNIEYGIKELSQKDGESEMEAYCWDLETNTLSPQKFVVRHERKSGGSITTLDDPRDIYEIGANMGARRLRARILAVIPADVVEDAVKECQRTLKGDNSEPIADKVKRMVRGFSKYGVNTAHLEQFIGCSLNDVTEDQYVELGGIFNSIRDGQSKPSDWFDVPKSAMHTEQAQDVSAELRGRGKAKATGDTLPVTVGETPDNIDVEMSIPDIDDPFGDNAPELPLAQ